MKTTADMNIDEVWDETEVMWKGSPADGDVHGYKRTWCRNNNYSLIHSCFFCDWAAKQTGLKTAPLSDSFGSACKACPGRDVDPKFNCSTTSYEWSNQPRKFYAKIKQLNKERLRTMSIDDKLAQYEKDLVIANDMVSKLLEEGRKLKEEKKQAEMPEFGDILLHRVGGVEFKRVALYNDTGKLCSFSCDSGVWRVQAVLPNEYMYTRTGRNIAEFLKTT